MPSLKAALDEIASRFTQEVLDALRSASLAEIRESAPRKIEASAPRASSRKAAKPGKPPRLHRRRPPEEIMRGVGQIMALLKKTGRPMRSEEIRKALSFNIRELPRVLKDGVRRGSLKSHGQRRGTKYTLAG